MSYQKHVTLQHGEVYIYFTMDQKKTFFFSFKNQLWIHLQILLSSKDDQHYFRSESDYKKLSTVDLNKIVFYGISYWKISRAGESQSFATKSTVSSSLPLSLVLLAFRNIPELISAREYHVLKVGVLRGIWSKGPSAREVTVFLQYIVYHCFMSFAKQRWQYLQVDLQVVLKFHPMPICHLTRLSFCQHTFWPFCFWRDISQYTGTLVMTQLWPKDVQTNLTCTSKCTGKCTKKVNAHTFTAAQHTMVPYKSLIEVVSSCAQNNCLRGR